MKLGLGKSLSDTGRTPHRLTTATALVVVLSVCFAALRVATAYMGEAGTDGDIAVLRMAARNVACGSAMLAHGDRAERLYTLKPAATAALRIVTGHTDFGRAIRMLFLVMLAACGFMHVSRRIGHHGESTSSYPENALLTALWIAVAALAIVVVLQMREFNGSRLRAAKPSRIAADMDRIVDYLKSRNVNAAYCDYALGALNLAGDGSVAFADIGVSGVPSLRRRLAETDRPAIINDHNSLESWVRASGGNAFTTNIGNVRIATDIVPPSQDVVELPSSRWRSLRDINGTDIMDCLSDRNLATAHRSGDAGDTLTLEFKSAEQVTAVRIIASVDPFIGSYSVAGKRADGDEFVDLCGPISDLPRCVWSGTRFYLEESSPIREMAFGPVTLSALRITLSPGEDAINGDVFEIQVLTPEANGTRGKSPPSADEWHSKTRSLVDLLHRQGIHRLYSGRWIANAVSRMTNGEIETNADCDIGHAEGRRGESRTHAIELDARTAILTTPSGSPSARDVFAALGLEMRKIDIDGLGTLFLPESNQNSPFGVHAESGIAFYADYTALAPSDVWVDKALESMQKPIPSDSLIALYRMNPNSVPLLRMMLAMPFQESILLSIRDSLDGLSMPSLGGDAAFGDVCTWHGARIMNRENDLTPGSFLEIRHYWSACGDVTPASRHRVRVRLIGPASYDLDDDFILNSDNALLDTMRKEDGVIVWRTDRRIRIPDDAPLGMYEMRLSVYEAGRPHRHVRVSTRLATSGNGITVNPVFALHSTTRPENQQQP